MSSLSPTPRCSVVIPTYNRAELLGHTLRSLTTQSLGRDAFEVLVVDDGSADQSREVALAFADCLNLRYFWQADEGYRVALARNVGARNAAAPICVFIDSGVMLQSRCLEAHCLAHERGDDRRAVIGYVYCFNKDNEDAEQIRATVHLENIDRSIHTFEAQGRWLDFREEFYGKYGDDFAWLPAPYLVFWTCNISVMTQELKAVGLFDEAFRAWGIEDVDLGYRLYRNGLRITLCREARSLHYPHAKNYEENMRSVLPNALYMASKYKTPIIDLLPHHEFFIINDMILAQGVPRCRDFLEASGRDLFENIRAPAR